MISFNSCSGVSLKIVLGNGSKTIEYDKVDVGSLQAKPENRGATFQVHTLSPIFSLSYSPRLLQILLAWNSFQKMEVRKKELPNMLQISHKVSILSERINYLSLGPNASISAAAGTLYRNYFVPHKINGTEYVGQLEVRRTYLVIIIDIYLFSVKLIYSMKSL